MDIRVNEVIAEFHGTCFEGVEEKNRRVQAGLGRYILYIRQGYCMDCREAKANGTCKASYANCPRLAMHTATGEFVCANCKLTISGQRDEKVLRLVATRPILRMTEILWNYSGNYAF